MELSGHDNLTIHQKALDYINHNKLEDLQRLLDMSLDIHCKLDELLCQAVQPGHLDMMRYWFGNNPYIDLPQEPSYQQVRQRACQIVELLLAKGADPRVKQHAPLYYSMLMGYADITKVLLKHYLTHYPTELKDRVDHFIKACQQIKPVNSQEHPEILDLLQKVKVKMTT